MENSTPASRCAITMTRGMLQNAPQTSSKEPVSRSDRLARRRAEGFATMDSLCDTRLKNAWNMIRGVEALSFCDWPGHNSMVLFCGGCNLRCPTCHNADLAWHHEQMPALSRARVLAMLAERKRWLDGLVLTGGEPSCVPGVEHLLQDLARIGLPIKMDSNGQKPEVLESLLDAGLVEQFFVDVKGPWRLYPELTGKCVSEERAQANMQRVFNLAAKRPEAFVFRLTRVPLLSDADVHEALGQLPEGFTLKLQKYHEPRRTYAQADQETRRLRRDMVA